MKTTRLYYQDAYRKTFTARLVECPLHAGQPAAVLDQTAFYPTSGGQPHDLGRLGGIEVVDVLEREGDGAVLHVLALPGLAGIPAGSELEGQMDWTRRFDHMQQHTGQHILSQAFVQVAQAETVGFHLGQDNVTIDLNRADLTLPVIEAAEDLANRVVFEDRPLEARFVTPAELERLPLRKPPQVEQDVRVVQVEGFDWSACGGTHVSSAGQVGLIKIVRFDRRGQETRLEFCCGWRALGDYRRKNAALGRAAAGLSVGYWELEEAVARLQAELKETHKKRAQAEDGLLRIEARTMAANVVCEDGLPFRVVVGVWADRDVVELRFLARHMVEFPSCVVLLATVGSDRCQFIFARSADAAPDMSAWLRQAMQPLNGRGGGQPSLAQGGCGPADRERVELVVNQVADQLKQASRGG